MDRIIKHITREGGTEGYREKGERDKGREEQRQQGKKGGPERERDKIKMEGERQGG